jgi:hypothetical protein
VDFITGLPRTKLCYDSIWVIMDQLTKVAHFIPVKTIYSGPHLEELYMSRIVCLHGVPMMRTSLLWIQPRLFVGVGVQLVFGLQESTYLRQLSWLHMDSNLSLLLLHGKIIKSTLRQIYPHVDTLSESVTITDFKQRCILSTVSPFLYAFIDDSENRLLPNNVMMIRNYGGDKEGVKERCGGAKEQQRRPRQVGVSIQVELKSNSDSRNSPHQNRHSDHIPTPFWTFFIWMER